MTWLLFFFALEFAWIPSGMIDQYDNLYENMNTFHTKLETEIMFFNLLYIGGEVKTIIHAQAINSFDPSMMDYGIEVGLKFNILNIFYRHNCIHPMMIYLRNLPNIDWEGSYDEIGIRVEGRL